MISGLIFFFFFQAEDGIRDLYVTGVQTCALPISGSPLARLGRLVTGAAIRPDGRLVAIRTYSEIYLFVPGEGGRLMPSGRPVCTKIGRASCRKECRSRWSPYH